MATLYTEEFFRLARARLRPDGVFGQWVQAYGIAVEDFASILRTFASVAGEGMDTSQVPYRRPDTLVLDAEREEDEDDEPPVRV